MQFRSLEFFLFVYYLLENDDFVQVELNFMPSVTSYLHIVIAQI